jgi:hypothetical protein
VCAFHRYASITGIHLPQAYISYRRASLAGVYLLQACLCVSHRHISHEHPSLTDIYLSQACISYRHTSLISMHLLQAFTSYKHTCVSPRCPSITGTLKAPNVALGSLHERCSPCVCALYSFLNSSHPQQYPGAFRAEGVVPQLKPLT